MAEKPLALYVSPSYPAQLEALGLRVAHVYPPPGLFDLPAYLQERGLKPDIVLQDEILLPRVFCRGLWELDCPKVFWSLDPHLNHFWQRTYCAQFDVVACTQRAWIEPLRRVCPGRVEWLTWSAEPGPCPPHAERRHQVAFVGRITDHRPLRGRFVDFLRSLGPVRIETDIPPVEVPDVYADTRLAPGESIQGEITQRLFLAASRGCLVLDPEGDNGLEELFEPGREVEVSAHPLELAGLLEHYRRRPQAAQALGRAAWERLRAEHQPAHRLAVLGGMARTAPAAAPRGSAGERLFWLAAAACVESGLTPIPAGTVLAGLGKSPEDPESVVAGVRLMHLTGLRSQALDLALGLAARGFAPDRPELAVAGTALALGQNRPELARAFLARLPHPGRAEPVPRAEAGIWAALGQALLRHGTPWFPGFPFDPEHHLPASALDCLAAALALDPGNQTLMRQVESGLRQYPGTELARLGLLSALSLEHPGDFRLGAALALADLKAYRVEEGLEELALARRLAREQGREQAFERLLAALLPRARARETLAGAPEV